MPRNLPRRLTILIAGVCVLGPSGCASTTPTTPPTTTSITASTSPVSTTAATTPVIPTTPTPSIAVTPVVAARNPAAMDAAVSYHPTIDPSDFVEVVDNPFWPLTPGTRTEFRTADEQIKIEVTSERKSVMGVSTVVVKDQVFADGKLVEDTRDWYAQDRAGNVWYFGEATTSYEVDPAGDHKGSWEGGVNGAEPGVVMLARPLDGDVYRQEYYAGQAEDLALVRRADGAIKVPAGSYRDLLVTEEWSPLEPDLIELKYYARGIGVVAERQILGGDEFVQLVKVTPARS